MNIEMRKNNIGLRKSTWRKKSRKRKRTNEEQKGKWGREQDTENKAAVKIS
jgi:hypothetical protein